MERKKLLIADDSEMNRAILANMLEQDFEIMEVSDGKEALAALQIYRKDLSALLLDVVMPGMDGFQVLEEMKQRQWLEDVPTVMISAETSSSYIDQAFELGAADYINRPFSATVVRRRIINTILLHTRRQEMMDILTSRVYRQEKSSEVMLSILNFAVEYRNGEGGSHMSGVEYLTGLLLRRVVEELYKGQDLAAARMTQQLEDAYAKQDFFTSLSDELWFDYTAQPSSLHLSRGLAEQTGLPSVILEPLQSPTLQMYLGKELTEGLGRQLEGLTLEETRLDLTTKLRLRGRLRRCQLSVQITWSARKQKRCAALLGKVTDIENRSQCIEQLQAEIQHAETPQALPQHSLPISASNGVIRITHHQLSHLFHTYQPLFETVRLVDPGICMQVTPGPDGPSVRENDYCYAMWCKKQRCERCISQDAVRTRQIQNKVESIGKDMYYIIAVCIEVDGTPYSLECMNPIRLDSGPSGQEEHLLNQLLMRNRQVYMDSATQVFNRRYYDEQLRELSGEYAVAMIDVDNFKQVNDRFGHAAGDAALYRVAQTMRSLLRSSDALVRYGGDEFFLLFQSLPRAVLHQKLEVLCCAVRELELPEFPELHLTISAGGVHGQGRVRDLILQADTALYEAKIKKDCVVVYEEDANEAE